MLGEGIDQGIEPAILDCGVVVEKHHELTPRIGGPGIAGTDEAQIFCIALVAQTGDGRQHLGRGVAGTVVDHDEFVRGAVASLGQRRQAQQGGIEMVVDRDHDAGHRRVAVGQLYSGWIDSCVRDRQRRGRVGS